MIATATIWLYSIFYRKMNILKKHKRRIFDTITLKFTVPQTMFFDENDPVEDEDLVYTEYREELLDYDTYL